GAQHMVSPRPITKTFLPVRDNKSELGRIRRRKDTDVLIRVTVCERTFAFVSARPLLAEIIPSHPHLNRRLCKIVEDIRWQFDVARATGEFQDGISWLRVEIGSRRQTPKHARHNKQYNHRFHRLVQPY